MFFKHNLLTYTTRFTKRVRPTKTTAPASASRKAPTELLVEIPITPAIHPPSIAPTMPITISPISPKPRPLVISPANHPITPPIKRNHTQYPIVLCSRFPLPACHQAGFLLLPVTVLPLCLPFPASLPYIIINDWKNMKIG
jgi:hypothetical protein